MKLSWQLFVSTSLLPATGIALGQHAPSLWWVIGVTPVLAIINMWLWSSVTLNAYERGHTAGHAEGHRKALHDSVHALRKTFGDGQ